MTMNNQRGTAKIVSSAPSNQGIIECNCGNKIKNHNKFYIQIAECPKCTPSLKIGEESKLVTFDSSLGKSGRHIVSTGTFRFFFLEDGLNVLFDKKVDSSKAKLY